MQIAWDDGLGKVNLGERKRSARNQEKKKNGRGALRLSVLASGDSGRIFIARSSEISKLE